MLKDMLKHFVFVGIDVLVAVNWGKRDKEIDAAILLAKQIIAATFDGLNRDWKPKQPVDSDTLLAELGKLGVIHQDGGDATTLA